MNIFNGLGNLAKDVEVKATTNSKVANFTIAINKKYNDKEGNEKESASFINCVAWGKLAEELEGATKGTRVFVSGSLQTRTYDDAYGNKKYITEVVADFVCKK